MRKSWIVVLLLFIASLAKVYSQDFVYTPVNPAFGGNPYNYSWLLSSAQAQNTFKEVQDTYSFYDEDPLKSFQDDLNRQILNEISTQLYFSQFGEDGLQEGSYEFGTFQINVSPTSEGMSIRIIDISTGSETTVIIPYY